MPRTTMLSLAEVAKEIGIGFPSAQTYRQRSLVNRRKADETGDQRYIRPGDLPPEDGHVSDRPFWYKSTIDHWKKNRPGPGGHNKETHKNNLLMQSIHSKRDA